MRCQDIMQMRVVTCREDESARACGAKMRDADIGFLPVVDAEGLCLGVVTDRDITIRVVAEGRSVATPAEAFMSTELVWCAPGDDISVAAERLKDAQVSRVLVIDDD